MESNLQSVVLGGGCFWCTEAFFQQLKGVVKVTPGYAGGQTLKPNYDQVVGGKTGHAEVVKVEFEPSVISLKDLLEVFFELHDPTSLNKQDYDVGNMYRSLILYSNPEQKTEAEKYIETSVKSGKYQKPIVTEVKPLIDFYPAEKEHQNYYLNNAAQPYCQIIISPKLIKLRKKFGQKLK